MKFFMYEFYLIHRPYVIKKLLFIRKGVPHSSYFWPPHSFHIQIWRFTRMFIYHRKFTKISIKLGRFTGMSICINKFTKISINLGRSTRMSMNISSELFARMYVSSCKWNVFFLQRRGAEGAADRRRLFPVVALRISRFFLHVEL